MCFQSAGFMDKWINGCKGKTPGVLLPSHPPNRKIHHPVFFLSCGWRRGPNKKHDVSSRGFFVESYTLTTNADTSFLTTRLPRATCRSRLNIAMNPIGRTTVWIQSGFRKKAVCYWPETLLLLAKLQKTRLPPGHWRASGGICDRKANIANATAKH